MTPRPSDPPPSRRVRWEARADTASGSLRASGLFGLLGAVALVGSLQVESVWFALAALGFFVNGLLFALGGRAQLSEERVARSRRGGTSGGDQPYVVALSACALGAVLAGLVLLARTLA